MSAFFSSSASTSQTVSQNEVLYDRDITIRTTKSDEGHAKLKFDELYMGFAVLAALRSKDDSCKVGCALADARRRIIIGVGWNGFVNDDEADSNLSWEKQGKNNFVIHAEANAINFSSQTLLHNCASLAFLSNFVNSEVKSDIESKDQSSVGITCFVTMSPCLECAKQLIQIGVSKVVYLATLRKYAEGIKILEDSGCVVQDFFATTSTLKVFWNFMKCLQSQGILTWTLDSILDTAQKLKIIDGEISNGLVFLHHIGLKMVEGTVRTPISWSQLHMAMAYLTSKRCEKISRHKLPGVDAIPPEVSDDHINHVGCVLIDDKKKVVAIGYRGPAKSIFPRKYESSSSFHTHVCAVMNAILFNNGTNLHGGTCFVTQFPCSYCLKHLAQRGINKVVYLLQDSEKHPSLNDSALSLVIECCKMEGLIEYCLSNLEVAKNCELANKKDIHNILIRHNITKEHILQERYVSHTPFTLTDLETYTKIVCEANRSNDSSGEITVLKLGVLKSYIFMHRINIAELDKKISKSYLDLMLNFLMKQKSPDITSKEDTLDQDKTKCLEIAKSISIMNEGSITEEVKNIVIRKLTLDQLSAEETAEFAGIKVRWFTIKEKNVEPPSSTKKQKANEVRYIEGKSAKQLDFDSPPPLSNKSPSATSSFSTISRTLTASESEQSTKRPASESEQPTKRPASEPEQSTKRPASELDEC